MSEDGLSEIPKTALESLDKRRSIFSRANTPQALKVKIAELTEAKDISDIEGQYEQKFRKYDVLNKVAFDQKVKQQLSQWHEQAMDRRKLNHEMHAGMLVIVDLNQFKAVNDTFGHNSGDEAMGMFLEAVRETIRKDDLLGRWGTGDEFMMYLTDSSAEALESIYFLGNEEGRVSIEERINQRIQELVDQQQGSMESFSWDAPRVDGKPKYLTSGVATIESSQLKDGREIDGVYQEMCDSADEKMYAAKLRLQSNNQDL